MKHIGNKYPVHDAALKVAGRAEYTTDMELPGMLYGKILFSPKAHAKITRIDTTAAEKLPGVHGVVTYLNSPDVLYNSYLRFEGHDLPKDERIFDRKVRFVGDRVAAVAADTPETAKKAVSLIQVEYEELPAVFSIDDAEKETAPRVHDNSSNVITEIVFESGDIGKGFGAADLIFEDTYRTPAVYHAALENHCALADYTPDGHLSVWCTTQNIFATRMLLCEIFDLPRSKVRVKKPILGGAFGGKVPMSVEPVAVLLSMRTGRPVKVELDRREDMASTNTRHASRVRIKTGVQRNGTITAQEINIVVNTGAYHTGGISVAATACSRIPYLYNVENLKITAVPLYANITPAGAMRGYGAPQGYFAQQVHLNKIARSLKIDFTDLQLKNLRVPDSINPMNGIPVGNVRGIECVQEGKRLFSWDEKKKKSKAAGSNKKRGYGMAVCSLWNGVYGVHIDATGHRITMNEDGTCILHTPTHDMGQGTTIILQQIVAEELGMELEDIHVVESDTDSCLWDLGAFASRGVFVNGEAARRTAQKIKKKLFESAELIYGCSVSNLELQEREVVDKMRGVRICSLHDLATRMLLERNEHIEVNHTFGSEADRTSLAAHFAEVEVDISTGKVEVLGYSAVHDVGKVINRLGIEGQLEGGVQMGLGYALSEELIRDNAGKLKNSNLKRYTLFRAMDMPEIECHFIEKEDLPGPYGGKSISEIATTPVAPAVVNAIVDALDRDFSRIPILPKHIIDY